MNKRVAHVISTPVGIGGAEKVMLALLQDGVARGWEQIVVNPFDLQPEESLLATQVRDSGVTYEGRCTRRIGEVPAARRWLGTLLRGWHPAIVHAHLFHALVLVAATRVPGALHIASHHHGGLFAVTKARRRQLLDRWAGQRMDTVVAPSHAVGRFLTESYGIASTKVEVIVNGWEGAPQQGSPSSKPVVLCVANLRPEKDHRTALAAFAEVAPTFPEAKLRLVGDGPSRRDILELVERLGIAPSVELAGSLADVWAELSRAQILLLTSRYETFGIAAVEAMAAGLPVIASDVAGLSEVVAHGRTGLLVPPQDVRGFAEAMKRLLGSAEMRTEMGKAGRETAQSWTMARTTAGYLDLYERLIQR